MSIRVMTLVWAHSKQQGNSLLLMLAIADFADDNGVAFPSVNTLAKKSRMSERNTHYAIAALQKAGELTIDRGAGRAGTNLYRISLNPALSLFPDEGGAKPAPGAKKAGGGAKRGAKGGATAIAPEPSEPSDRTVKVPRGASPSPVAAAFKAYQAGLKKLNGADYPPSAKANGQLAQVVARVGGANVVAVVQFYLASSNPYYRKRRFPLDVLVKDCEQLYMDIQRASGGGGSGQVLDAKPVVRLMCADETVARDLGEFPLGSPIDVAKKVFGSYRGMIARLVSGGSKLRYLDVMLGQARHRFSLAELEADPHA